MQDKIITKDNFIFLLCAVLSAVVCSLILGIDNVTLGVVSVMFTFIIYSAKPNNGDYVYTFIWISIILLGCYIGIYLKLSFGFYIFLFIISSYYYITINKDSFSDRAVPFLVIYASLGTSMKKLPLDSALAFLIGAVVALIVLGIAHQRKVEFTAFKTGLFSKTLYANSPHVLLNSIIYSLFLFLCLYLPNHLGLARTYWAPMTFIILLKPKDENIVKNTLGRFWGSVVGAIFVFILLHLDMHFKIINLVIIAVCVFLLPSFFKLNFFLKTFGITTFILVLLESAEYWKNPDYTLTYLRIFETFIGGSLAILASLLLKYLRKHNLSF